MKEELLWLLATILDGLFFPLLSFFMETLGFSWHRKSPADQKGKIVAKHHLPERHLETPGYQSNISLQDSAWTIEVKYTDAGGKPRTKMVNVSKQKWRRLKIGQKYRID